MLKQKSAEILSSVKGYFENLTAKTLIGDIIWVLCLIFLLNFCVHPISGLSMYPTYNDGQYAFCSRIILKIDRGDVVVAWLPEKSEYIIKRVAGIPGDELWFSTDGNLYVNGEKYEYGEGDLYTEWYQYGEELTEEEDGSLTITLGDGEYFLIGDNHTNSLDSRYWGPFKRNSIKQKVLFVI